ncbi:DUF2922 domain-containing protein [Clostridium sp. 19966]|uniref:DUF2922 domain-containing protein n=1 Tax=Clostridium sp. 19966 TaxID=2768166 RepID=UPI0028DF35BE|nr:DUF2922 domain-containing protein [Clostridium sp. 19966]MDT8719609.1 DUF2922 domain-containing protein [Clostridium sp. 19966]
MAKTLSMTFTNEANKSTSFTLDYIKEDLTNEQVSTVMDLFINKNIFSSTGGDLKGKSAAQIVDKNVSKLELK